jgi:hypothetical protein
LIHGRAEIQRARHCAVDETKAYVDYYIAGLTSGATKS